MGLRTRGLGSPLAAAPQERGLPLHTTVTRLVRGCHTAVTHTRGCQGRPGAGRGGRCCPAPGRPRRARQQQEGPGRAAMAGEEREGREGAGEGAGASAGRSTGWGAPPLAAQPRAGLCWVMLGCAGLYWVILGALRQHPVFALYLSVPPCFWAVRLFSCRCAIGPRRCRVLKT